MKHSVLCISRSFLPTEAQQPDFKGLVDFDIDLVQSNAYHFINRDIVDAKKEADGFSFEIGKRLPQILASVLITNGDDVFTYMRANGAETRLHGSRSISVGGHVDIGDANLNEDGFIEALNTILLSMSRELEEEVGIDLESDEVSTQITKKLIVDNTVDVGAVHVGLLVEVKVNTKDLLTPTEECYDPQWVNKKDLVNDVELYEPWGQIVINGLLK